jgi:hypothetical protein
MGVRSPCVILSGAGRRQRTESLPQDAESFDGEKVSALVQAGLHPLVRVLQIAAAARARESASARISVAQCT